ncbi:MAG: hypothetical protein R2713_20115 [Ilumatobacteraceae bacterium]
MDTPPELTPAQRRLLDQLRKDAEPLVFDADFVDDVVRRAGGRRRSGTTLRR